MTVKVKKRKVAPLEVAALPPKSPKSPSHNNAPVNNTVNNYANNSAATNTSNDSGNQPPWSPVYSGGSKLDSDTIHYIHRIYCRECQRMEEQRRKEKEQEAGVTQPPTSPQTQVEEQSLQQTMDKNKESLKRKLMLRRSVNELVDQGIYPPLKTPPAFAEQRKQLERAKTGDLLRQKLKQRPDRQSLVQHHILEDTKPNVDPSLQEKQRLLKRARLQDSLTDQLANRPGPLELVQGNILQAEPELKDAIQDGILVFPKTRDVDDPKRRHFQAMETEDSSNASDSAQSPQTGGDTSDQSASPGPAIPTPPDITPLLQKLQQSGAGSPVTFTFAGTMPPITSQTFSGSPTSTTTTMMAGLKNATISSSSRDSRDKGMRIKKKTPKPAAKSKVIKFHEYKGPPSALKNSVTIASPTAAMSPSPPIVTATIASPPGIAVSAPSLIPSPGPPGPPSADSTPYNVMLQQQQLFLQWQLEHQQKNMPFILPTPGKAGSLTGDSTSASSTPVVTPCATPVPLALATTPGPPGVSATPPPAALTQPVQQTSVVPTNAIKVPAIAASSIGSYTVVPSVLSTSIITQPAPAPSTISTPATQTQTVLAPIPLKITKLEDMKVADLKIELKKRNLPVSGPKPQLIERLKMYSEAISNKQQQHQQQQQQQSAIGSTSSAQSSTPSISSISSVCSVSSISSEVSLTSPPSVASFGNIINIQPVTPLNDDVMSMTMGSPPMSPSNGLLELNASLPPALSEPTSPENLMDVHVQSPTGLSLLNQHASKMSSRVLSSSQTLVPVKIEPVKMDASRPPSAVPMEVDPNLSLSHLNMVAAMSGAAVTQVVAPICSTGLLATVNQNPYTAPPTPQGPSSQPATPQVPTSQPPTPVASSPMTPSPAQIIVQTQAQPTPALQTITIQPESTYMPQTQSTFTASQAGQLQALPHQQLLSQLAQVTQSTKSANASMPSSMQMAQQIQQIQANLQAVQASMQQAVQQAQLQATNLSQVTCSVPQMMTSPQGQVHTSVAQLPTSTGVLSTQPGVAQTIQHAVNVPVSQAPAAVGPHGVMQVQVTPVQQQQQQLAPAQTQAQPLGQPQAQPLGQPQVISQDEMVRQQQRQIEDLRRMVLQSQQSLQEAQQKTFQHQEQLKMALAQAAQTQQFAMVPPIAISSQADTKATSQSQTIVQPQQVYAQIQLQPMAQPPPPPPLPPPQPSPRPAQTFQQQSPQPQQSHQHQHHLQQPVPQQHHQPVAPVTVIPTTVTTIKSEPKPNINALSSLIQTQAIQQTLLGQNKVLLNVMQQPNGQQVIITSQPNAKVTLANHILNNQNKLNNPNNHSLTVNGLTNNAANRTSSVPNSPSGHNKLQRTSTNPFFNSVPLREPPKYDEAIKNKQNLLLQQNANESETGSSSLDEKGPSSVKSQAMDDVLEILIRNGELPPSAAQEPPPTPKTEANGKASVTKSTANNVMTNGNLPQGMSTILIPASSTIPTLNHSHMTSATVFSNGGLVQMKSATSTASAMVFTTTAISAPVTTAAVHSVSSPPMISAPSPAGSTASTTSSRKGVPPPLEIDAHISTSHHGDLPPSAFADGLPSSFSDLPFISMDWSDSDLPDNLLDTPNANGHTMVMNGLDGDADGLLCGVPTSCVAGPTNGELQNGLTSIDTNLNSFGLGDVEFTDAANDMNIDVSDWLDVIMPSTGLTPMSSTAPAAFPSDPILTPKPQDVLDLFNMEESDLYTPTDLGMNFDKVIEASVSNS